MYMYYNYNYVHSFCWTYRSSHLLHCILPFICLCCLPMCLERLLACAKDFLQIEHNKPFISFFTGACMVVWILFVDDECLPIIGMLVYGLLVGVEHILLLVDSYNVGWSLFAERLSLSSLLFVDFSDCVFAWPLSGVRGLTLWCLLLIDISLLWWIACSWGSINILGL